MVGVEEIVGDLALCRQRAELRKGPQPELFALTIYRPMAQALIHGPKRIENRDWLPEDFGASLAPGDWLAIHAGKVWDHDAWDWLMLNSYRTGWSPPEEEECRSGIIGVARFRYVADHPPMVGRYPDQVADPWWMGPYGWLFSEVVPFPSPIPVKGHSKLWPVLGDLKRNCRVQWTMAKRYAK